MQRYVEAWSVYLTEGIDRFLPYLDENVVWEEYVLAPGAQTWHGHDGFRSLYRHWQDDFDDFRFEPLEAPVELAPGDIATLVSVKGRGRASGIEIDLRLYLVSRFVGDRIGWAFYAETLDEARARLAV